MIALLSIVLDNCNVYTDIFPGISRLLCTYGRSQDIDCFLCIYSN